MARSPGEADRHRETKGGEEEGQSVESGAPACLNTRTPLTGNQTVDLADGSCQSRCIPGPCVRYAVVAAGPSPGSMSLTAGGSIGSVGIRSALKSGEIGAILTPIRVARHHCLMLARHLTFLIH